MRQDRGSGNTTRLYDGVTVELVAVGRGQKDSSGESLADERPVWRPDGSPLLGGRASGSNPVMRPAATMEGKGARYLSFRIAPRANAVRAEEATVTGYVPDGAHVGTPHPELHGWDAIDRIWIPRDFGGGYRTCVVVDDRSASRYRLAIARGEWKVARRVSIAATEMTDAVLAQGPWGRLRRVAPPKDRGVGRYSARGMPVPTFVVDPPAEPAAFDYQLRLLDAGGNPNASVGSWAKPRSFSTVGGRQPAPAVSVEVATRRFEWIEFTGVHYDPDPAKWAKGYWGDEGEAAISRSGGTSLQALIRPVPNEFNGWDAGEVYAPDGKLWRGHPNHAAIAASFSGGTYPEGALVAAFGLEADRVANDRPARIEAFAATGTAPGQGLGASLAKSAWSTRPVSQMLVPRPKTPYVQFAVRYASERWTKAGEIAVPRFRVPQIKPEERAGYEAESSHFTVFSVCLRSYGQADLYWHTRGERVGYPGSEHADKRVTWPKDEEARVVARLKSGRRVPLAHNSVGVSPANGGTVSLDIDFELTANDDARYSHAGGVDSTRVLLSEVSAFEIETRSYDEPIYVAAKLP